MQEARTVQVNNDRMVRRPPFRLEDLPYCRRVLRVGAQPINSLGGKGHELTVPQRLDGGLDLDLCSSDDANHSGNDSSKL